MHANAAALDDAINRGDIAQVAALLDQGVDPNVRGPDGATPLMAAAWIGVSDLVRLLIVRGADPTLHDLEGRTALDRLVANEEYWHDGHDAVLEHWLACTSDVIQLPLNVVRHEVPPQLQEICAEIVSVGWDEAKWSQHEADDWWQSAPLEGGYDATEQAFCFSYYSPSGQEWWLQFTLPEALQIASGSLTVVASRRAMPYWSRVTGES